MKTKQAIIWRNDLKEVPWAKKMVQCGHAAHMFLNEKLKSQFDGQIKITPEEAAWMLGEYKKVVLVVRSQEELQTLYEAATQAGLHSYLVKDNAHTVFSEPTITCLAIGPNAEEEVDKITGEHGPLGKLRLG